MADIYFKTERTAEGTVFHLVPPPPSRLFSAVLWIAAVMMIGSVLANTHWLYQFQQLVFGLVFWGGLFFVLIRWRMKYIEKTQPFTITVVPEGLMVRDVFYAREDIAELTLAAPGARAPSGGYAIAGGGIAGALSVGMMQGAMNASQVIAANADARSYSLMLRKRSISKPIRLVAGLTHQTGAALVNDIHHTWN
jgi:hypothetical protein